MTNYSIGQFVIAELGNLRFGGKIIMKVETINFVTKVEQIEYLIESPDGLYSRVNTILSLRPENFNNLRCG
jgi:hypothetical protein